MTKRIGFLLASLALLVVLWQTLAMAVSAIRGVQFPTPATTGVTLIHMLFGAELCQHLLYKHVLDSLGRWIIGFGFAAVLGTAYGLLAGWYRHFEALTAPIVHVLQLIPGLAWLPVALLVFGISTGATVFMIAVTAFCPIALNVLAGVKRVDATYIRAARMMGARGSTLLLRVLMPGSLPHMLSGLRLGLGNGWRVLVAAEMIVGAGTGLGYSIIQARWTLDYNSAFGCIVIICVIGLVVEQFVFAPLETRTVERWGLPRAA
jgi:ABC-type nitrate/sulfonate/bicarbonate transport system permease component